METKFYVARDDNGTLWLYLGKPSRQGSSWRTSSNGNTMSLPDNLFNIDTSSILEVEVREKGYLPKEGIDVNDQVEITLTAYGAKILNIRQNEFLKEHPDIKLKFKKWREGDKYENQLWSIIESFGSNQGVEIAFTNLKKI